MYSARMVAPLSRVVSQRPKVGEPFLRSTTKSCTSPAGQHTYLAMPGGHRVKWMPRTVPRREVL
jgi:hypothetical protein